jgi:hypothetical protein
MPTNEEILTRFVALVKTLALENSVYLSAPSRHQLQLSVEMLNSIRTKPVANPTPESKP